MAPPIFSGELYIVWTFAGYMQVYTYKLSLHDNFQTFPISACGAMTSFWSEMGPFQAKIGQNVPKQQKKQWEQWNFEFFLAHSIVTIILCLLNKFGVILTTTAHFLDDFIFFGYSKYMENP